MHESIDDTFTGKDVLWLEAHVHLPPSQFFSRYFRFRERSTGKRYAERVRHSVFLRALVTFEDYGSIWLDGELVEPLAFYRADLVEGLVSLSGGDHDLFCRAALDAIRGYTETEVNDFALIATKEKARLLRTAVKRLKENSQALKRAAKANREATCAALTENRETIASLQEELASLDPLDIAVQRLKTRNSQRLIPSWGFFAKLNDPLKKIMRRLDVNPPAHLEMPLRFLGQVSMPTWRALIHEARSGASRNSLLDALESHEDIPQIVKSLKLTDVSLTQQGMPDRSNAVNELLSAWDSGLWMAAALVSTALTEGRLWDVAALLNRRGTRIYQRRSTRSGHEEIFPITWDRTSQRYVRTNRKLTVQKHRLTSAKELLRRTRLGAMIHRDLYTYLIEEHTDYRNQLVHGRLKEPLDRYDAVLAILSCAETLQEIAKIAGKNTAV